MEFLDDKISILQSRSLLLILVHTYVPQSPCGYILNLDVDYVFFKKTMYKLLNLFINNFIMRWQVM